MRECSPPIMCHMSGVRCQVSGVRCQVSGVRCPVSGVRCKVLGVGCHMSHVTFQVICVFLFFFGRNCEAGWCRVCYQQGLPRISLNNPHWKDNTMKKISLLDFFFAKWQNLCNRLFPLLVENTFLDLQQEMAQIYYENKYFKQFFSRIQVSI